MWGGALAIPRDCKILAAMSGSVMAAMMRRCPEQSGQVSTSIRKTRRSSCAQESLCGRRTAAAESDGTGSAEKYASGSRDRLGRSSHRTTGIASHAKQRYTWRVTWVGAETTSTASCITSSCHRSLGRIRAKSP